MPTMMGKSKAQQKLIDNLDGEFAKVWIKLCTTTNHMSLLWCDKD